MAGSPCDRVPAAVRPVGPGPRAWRGRLCRELQRALAALSRRAPPLCAAAVSCGRSRVAGGRRRWRGRPALTSAAGPSPLRRARRCRATAAAQAGPGRTWQRPPRPPLRERCRGPPKRAGGPRVRHVHGCLFRSVSALRWRGRRRRRRHSAPGVA